MLATADDMIADGKHLHEQLAQLANLAKNLEVKANAVLMAWQVLADAITKQALAAEILAQLETLNGVNTDDISAPEEK